MAEEIVETLGQNSESLLTPCILGMARLQKKGQELWTKIGMSLYITRLVVHM